MNIDTQRLFEAATNRDNEEIDSLLNRKQPQMNTEYDKKERDKAIAAVKDVLYMYTVLLNYSGFFDDFGTEDGKFNPYDYIDCNAKTLGIEEDEASLLHEGSAIKIICGILFSWGQGNHPEEETYYVKMYNQLILENRMEHIPKLRDAIQLCIESDDKFWVVSNKLYQNYVVGYFKKLLL